MNNDIAYLDNAASEPLRPQAAQAYAEALAQLGGIVANPSSSHSAGRAAAVVLEDARGRIARCLGADPAEVIFTGGGSESVALAVRGLALGMRNKYAHLNRVLYSATEHDCVREAAYSLRREGFETAELAVDSQGISSPEELFAQLRSGHLGLFSQQLVNNENGVLKPLYLISYRIAQWCSKAEVEKPLIHCDAVAAVGRFPVDFHELKVDALSIAGHKFGAFAGSGVLLLKRDVPFISERSGGGQERKIRGGTQDVLLAAAMAAALETATLELEIEQRRQTELAQRLLAGMIDFEGVHLVSELAPRVSGIMQFILDGCEAEALLMALDMRGICASAGSACHTGVARPSNVLLAQGYTETQALGSLRISLGWNTSEEDIDKLLKVLPDAIETSRRFSAGVNARGKK